MHAITVNVNSYRSVWLLWARLHATLIDVRLFVCVYSHPTTSHHGVSYMSSPSKQVGSASTAYVEDQCRAVVRHRRDEAGEYRVRLYYHSQALPDADYFTSDRADAHGTAQAMVSHLAHRVRMGQFPN